MGGGWSENLKKKKYWIMAMGYAYSYYFLNMSTTCLVICTQRSNRHYEPMSKICGLNIVLENFIERSFETSVKSKSLN